MRRKYNPQVALMAMAALVLLATILVLTCTGCTTAAAETEKTPDRFTIEKAQYDDYSEQILYIITDTETGVQYLFFKDYKSGGMTVLQPGGG